MTENLKISAVSEVEAAEKRKTRPEQGIRITEHIKQKPDPASEARNFRAQKVGDLINNLENKNEVDFSKESIEEMLDKIKWLREIIGKVEPEQKKRIEKEINFIENELSQRRIVESLLEKRDLSKMFHNMEAGDLIITIVSPMEKSLEIKTLNDILSQSITDNIIGKRRELIIKKFESKLSRLLGREKIDKDIYSCDLEQNFKFSIFKINKNFQEQISRQDLEKMLNEISFEADLEMREFIQPYLENFKYNLSFQMREKDCSEDEKKRIKARIKKIEKIEEDLKNIGFKNSFGVSELEDDKIESKVGALSNAYAASIMNAVSLKEETGKEIYGKKFEKEDLKEYCEKINDFREDIGLNKTIKSADNELEFLISKKNENNIWELSEDVLVEIRKGNFDKFSLEDQETVKKINQYIKSLNIFDFFKPFFTSKTLKDFEERSQKTYNLLEKYKNGEISYLPEVKKLLETNKKASEGELVVSDECFAREGLELKNKGYLFVDILNAAVFQIHQYEELQQKIVSGELSPEDAMLLAGDILTEKMELARTQIYNILNKFPAAKKEDGRVRGDFSGGDEFKILLDLDQIEPEKMEEIIEMIARETNSRVVFSSSGKTIASGVSRKSISDNEKEKNRDFVLMQEESEEIVDKLKDIEKIKRIEVLKLQKRIKNLNQNSELKENDIKNITLKALEGKGLDNKLTILPLKIEDDLKFKIKHPEEEFCSDCDDGHENVSIIIQGRFKDIDDYYLENKIVEYGNAILN